MFILYYIILFCIMFSTDQCYIKLKCVYIILSCIIFSKLKKLGLEWMFWYLIMVLHTIIGNRYPSLYFFHYSSPSLFFSFSLSSHFLLVLFYYISPSLSLFYLFFLLSVSPSFSSSLSSLLFSFI